MAKPEKKTQKMKMKNRLKHLQRNNVKICNKWQKFLTPINRRKSTWVSNRLSLALNLGLVQYIGAKKKNRLFYALRFIRVFIINNFWLLRMYATYSNSTRAPSSNPTR